jgi:hypothetical protein
MRPASFWKEQFLRRRQTTRNFAWRAETARDIQECTEIIEKYLVVRPTGWMGPDALESNVTPSAGTEGRGEGRGGKDRRSATRLIRLFRMIRRPSRRTCSRGTLRAWS